MAINRGGETIRLPLLMTTRGIGDRNDEEDSAGSKK